MPRYFAHTRKLLTSYETRNWCDQTLPIYGVVVYSLYDDLFGLGKLFFDELDTYKYIEDNLTSVEVFIDMFGHTTLFNLRDVNYLFILDKNDYNKGVSQTPFPRYVAFHVDNLVSIIEEI